MAAWTPSDLTNPSFVATQLSAKDRSTALYSVTNELTSAQSRLAQQEAALTAAQTAANNGPSRGEINALKAKSNDPNVPPAEREAAAQQAANLADERDKLNVAADNALQQYNNTNRYVSDLAVGQSNLLQAGAVPPGVNQFDVPPGYEGRSDPAAQVPASQNPSSTPTETSEQLQSASPALVTGPTGTPYDDNGNLNPGWGIGDNGDPVWVEAGYIDSTGEVIGKQQTVPNTPSTGTPYDDNGNLNPGWGISENGDPVWIEAGYIDATLSLIHI
jgi:hypothetical protein